MSRGIRVLVVDDDPDVAQAMADYLEHARDRFEAVTETSARGGLDRLAVDPVDCVVSDYDMPDTDGLAFLRSVRADRPELPFVLYTGRGDETVASDAIAAGVTDYVLKGESGANALLAKRVENAVEHYRAERAVEETRERFRSIVRSARDVVLVLDRTGTITYASPSTERILGRPPAALVGTSAFESVHPEDQAAVRDEFERVVADPDGDAAVEFRYQRSDGEWTWIEARGRNRLGDPTVEGVVVFARDVTERTERERELARYETLVDTVGDPMYVLEPDGTLATVNEAMAAQLGLPREEIVGEHVRAFMPEDDVERGNETIRELLADDDRRWATFEMRSLSESGDTFYNETKIAVLTDEDGTFTGSVGVVRDITERKRSERELERQNERLGQFASIVSHDLRNPLTVAEGRLELVQELLSDAGDAGVDEELLEAAAADHLGEVDWALDRMRTLIDDLLVLAREGKAVDELERVALDDVVEECWQTVETPTAELTVATDASVRADRSRLCQLLANLVRNAIEHAGETVHVTVGDLEDGAGFYLADDGPGIPAAERETVLEDGYTTADDGTGYGLSIVTEVADAHGWAVDVTEGSDGGARFEIRDVEVLTDREAAAPDCSED